MPLFSMSYMLPPGVPNRASLEAVALRLKAIYAGISMAMQNENDQGKKHFLFTSYLVCDEI